jgi:hypothetical protein
MSGGVLSGPGASSDAVGSEPGTGSAAGLDGSSLGLGLAISRTSYQLNWLLVNSCSVIVSLYDKERR